jgi:hypothetical protein
MTRGRLCRAFFVAATTVFAHASCSKDFAPEPGAGSECSINSDCPAPLRCAFSRCHMACDETRDCPPGQRCIASDRPFHVCQLPDETKCAYNSECPEGQVCGASSECRDPCASDRDCVRGQRCVSKACVEPAEVLDAAVAPVSSESGSPANGSRCTFSSDCPVPYVCHEGNCRFECVAQPDCPPNYSCSSNRCVPPICGGEQSATAALGGASCRFSSECASPLVCRRGFCNCECLGDRDCSGGLVCGAHRCVPRPVARDAGFDAPTGVDAGRSPP